MTEIPTPTAARWWYLLALLFIFGGFALEIYAVIIDSWAMFRTGLVVFLLCIPCAGIGWYLKHRDRIRARQ